MLPTVLAACFGAQRLCVETELKRHVFYFLGLDRSSNSAPELDIIQPTGVEDIHNHRSEDDSSEVAQPIFTHLAVSY